MRQARIAKPSTDNLSHDRFHTKVTKYPKVTKAEACWNAKGESRTSPSSAIRFSIDGSPDIRQGFCHPRQPGHHEFRPGDGGAQPGRALECRLPVPAPLSLHLPPHQPWRHEAT